MRNTVLIADADPRWQTIILDYLTEALRNMGLEFATAADARQALDFIQEARERLAMTVMETSIPSGAHASPSSPEFIADGGHVDDLNDNAARVAQASTEAGSRVVLFSSELDGRAVERIHRAMPGKQELTFISKGQAGSISRLTETVRDEAGLFQVGA